MVRPKCRLPKSVSMGPIMGPFLYGASMLLLGEWVSCFASCFLPKVFLGTPWQNEHVFLFPRALYWAMA